ncbi:MAG: hypothetical protein D4R82_03405 [Dehalococcoidia bacterium]|nr:MAG: hypothetical protein D4R82_03405 [Dehalococcoidia bacterium]
MTYHASRITHHPIVCIIGSGYVGLVTGACLTKLANEVTFIDVDSEKLAAIRW